MVTSHLLTRAQAEWGAKMHTLTRLESGTWTSSPSDVRDTQQGAGLSSPKANPESAPGEAGLALPPAVTAAPPPPRDGVRGGTSSGGLEVMRPPRCGDNEDHVVSQNSYPCPSIINK